MTAVSLTDLYGNSVSSGSRAAVDAYDRDFKTLLATGSVLALDNQIDQTTGTVKIKAIFPNENFALYANQFVNARLLVDTLSGAILVLRDGRVVARRAG